MAAKKMTPKADQALDRRLGIKQGSKLDRELDRKTGVAKAEYGKGYGKKGK